MLLFSFTLLPLLVHLSWQRLYFCKLKCPKGGTHTVCKYDPCLPHDKCGDGFLMLQLRDEERALIRTLHNHYRHVLASGNYTQGGNAKASNLRTMWYSKELEFVAQCWANQCNAEGEHDECRSINGFTEIGQNVYVQSLEMHTDTDDLRTAVASWYSEMNFTTANVIESFKFDARYEHFTQMMWAKTQYIGCGRTVFGSSGKMSLLVVCNYAVAGNVPNESVYKFGEGCSDCGSLPCNSPLDNLCGNLRLIEDDRWKEPFPLRPSSSVKISVLGLLLLLSVGVSCVFSNRI